MPSNRDHTSPTNLDNGQRERLPHHIDLGAQQLPYLQHEHPPFHFARPRHTHIPLHNEPGFDEYRAHRKIALEITIHNLSHGLFSRSPLHHIVFGKHKLTVQYNSQSKLSQQELADLQKATHFDKKELQQWYKGSGASHLLDDVID